MADKQTKLSIVIATVDKATAKIKAINAQLDKVAKPVSDFKKELGKFSEKSGLDDVIGGFKGVGSAVGEVLSKVALVGGVVGIAAVGLLHLVDEFDDLGKKAERLGVSVDFLAQLRYAAEKTGVPVEALDDGMKAFSENVGQARAHTGRLYKFLGQISPKFQQQFLATKNTAEAFDLLGDAMAKVADPAKRAALAKKAVGDSVLAPLLARGSKGIKALGAEATEHEGSLEGAAKAAASVHDSMIDLKASTEGVKAALLEGLAPALKVIVDQLSKWFDGHRGAIKEWAASLGEKIPAAFDAVRSAVGSAIDFLAPFFDSATKIKVALAAVAAVIVGPLIYAVGALGIALLTTPVGWIIAGIAAIAAGAYLLINNWDGVKGFFVDLWDTIKKKTGWFADFVELLLAPIIGVPVLIIGAWSGIGDFFTSLWDGISSAFSSAWDRIKPIVDKIETAVGVISGVKGFLFDGPEKFAPVNVASVAAQAGAAAIAPGLAASASPAFSKIVVDFTNAPRGTRVATDPQSSGDVHTNVGYQMAAAL